MTYVRPTVRPVAIVWLVCHLWIGLLASVMVSTRGSVEGAEMVCHCQHGAGHECPMHKTTSGKARCAIRAANDMSGAAGISSLLGPLGLLSCAVNPRPPDDVARSLLISRFNVIGRPTAPALPPPRA
jgi:hypothetical protein